MESYIKRMLPRSLLGRTLAILVTPLVIVQLVSGIVFYQGHWDTIMERLARGVAGDLALLVHLLPKADTGEDRERIFSNIAGTVDIVATYRPGGILSSTGRAPRDAVERTLKDALSERVRHPLTVDNAAHARMVVVEIQLGEGVLRALVPRKRLFSSTVWVFALWSAGSALILLGVAVVFMRNQVKPIRRLAAAADSFGKGRDISHLKPEGAREVRQAAAAFLAMRERIQRQISQRTAMLSGVSHDLRTPLARMKLQLEMMGPIEGAADLKADVAEMERMLEEYLSFARGEGTEAPVPVDLGLLLDEIAATARREGRDVAVRTEGDLVVPIRAQAIRRAISNVMVNALRHGKKIEAAARRLGEWIEITIDDDGPGVPPESREDVFRPFFRLEASRNPATGGVGLGLAIVRDIMRGHGGEAMIEGSPLGGARARLRLPV
ncbi:MAG: HAMP domain-containing protein [Alphaproteobacteria bacterium]|nr:HAMP domain-containing protein [Alphaproteobacteria bacterium]